MDKFDVNLEECFVVKTKIKTKVNQMVELVAIVPIQSSLKQQPAQSFGPSAQSAMSQPQPQGVVGNKPCLWRFWGNTVWEDIGDDEWVWAGVLVCVCMFMCVMLLSSLLSESTHVIRSNDYTRGCAHRTHFPRNLQGWLMALSRSFPLKVKKWEGEQTLTSLIQGCF